MPAAAEESEAEGPLAAAAGGKAGGEARVEGWAVLVAREGVRVEVKVAAARVGGAVASVAAGTAAARVASTAAAAREAVVEAMEAVARAVGERVEVREVAVAAAA